MFDTPRTRGAGSAHDAARRRLEALSSSLASELGSPGEPGADGSRGNLADPYGRHHHGVADGSVTGSPRPATVGRHAARPRRGLPSNGDQQDDEHDRLGARWGHRLPLPVRSAVWGRFGAHHLAVLVLLLATALCLAAWWALSARPEVQVVPGTASPPSAVPAPTAPSVAAAPAPETPTTSAAGQIPGDVPAATPAGDAAGEQLVVVDVAGKVRRPGIVTLPWGSRVADALEAAGGVRPTVDLVSLNLARVLVDGEQLLVGVQAATVPVPVPDPAVVPQPGATPAAPTILVNLNTATLADLDTLPGVGPVTAEAILTWRTENGAFSTVDELLEVSGIGDVTLEELRDLVTV